MKKITYITSIIVLSALLTGCGTGKNETMDPSLTDAEPNISEESESAGTAFSDSTDDSDSLDTQEATMDSAVSEYFAELKKEYAGDESQIRGLENIEKVVSENPNYSDFRLPEIKESGWMATTFEEVNYVTYYVIAHNPNEKIGIKGQPFTITMKNVSGELVNEDQANFSINDFLGMYPEQDVIYHSSIEVDEIPDSVEFNLSYSDSEIMWSDTFNVDYSLFLSEPNPVEFKYVGKQEDGYHGKIINNGEKEDYFGRIWGIGKNSEGKFVYIYYTEDYSRLEPGASEEFVIPSELDYDISKAKYGPNGETVTSIEFYTQGEAF